MVIHTTGSRKRVKIAGFGADSLHFFHFLVTLAGNFDCTKSPRESFLVAYDCCPLHPTPSRLTVSLAENRGLSLLVRSDGMMSEE